MTDPSHPKLVATSAFGLKGWSEDRDRPEQVGMIRCCNRIVVMRNGRIICDVCDTVVETGRGEHLDCWQIVRAKGVDV